MARQQRPTLIDVAEAAGVSKALVSIVMRGAPGAGAATRERVLRIAAEMGYVPDQRARNLRSTATGVLGVTFELREPFHGDLVDEIYGAAADAGRDVLISAVTARRPESVALQTLLRERCEAAILVGSRSNPGEIERLTERIPVTLVVSEAAPAGAGDVRGDDAQGVQLAVDHLVSLGHRRIAHIDGGDAPGGRVRRDAFVQSMAAHRRTRSASVISGGITAVDGARAIRGLLDAPSAADQLPTAILAFNDECATGVIDVLIRTGKRVPEDISVIGYDDTRFASLLPVPLTTVSQDAHGLARHALEAVVAMADNETPRRIVVPPKLMVRATTAAPPR
ncbi:LacI family DNA-binding transcriptional regulator [Gordonia sp. NPDC003422]